jgi:molybdopterin-guanine dinucleotide biosynthesis protein
MTGGSATHAGIGFQDQVAGFLSVHILADAPVDFFELPAGAAPTSIDLETAAPVDDILIGTSASGFCFINVKRGVTTSTKSESPLSSVLDQFVRLWIACQSGGSSRSWQRPLDLAKDRMVLVTGGERSTTFTTSLSKVLGRIGDRASLARDAVTNTESERAVYDAVVALLRLAFRRHTGGDVSDDTITSLLRLTRVTLLDPEGRDKANSLILLKNAVVEEPADAERAWGELVSTCQRLAENRSGADRAGLRSALVASGVRLHGAPEIAGDVRQLQGFTTDTLSSLAHLAHLDVPTSKGTERIEIQRAVADALVHHARQTSLLIIGEPGSGKSGALYSAARKLIDQGYPVLAIAVDRHPVTTADELRRDLRLDRPLIDVLRNWTGDKPGVLFIDALDATRGGPSDRVFQELIRRVLDHAPNWRVVASIRVFDLKFGVTYRDLFVGSPVDGRYQDSDFRRVRHISIPRLTDQELDQVWSKSPLMGDVYREGTATLRDLLRSPFNLFLFANVLSFEKHDLRDVTTQLQLLHLYWSHRVIGTDRKGLSREALLRAAVERMLDAGTLQVSLHPVPGASVDDISRLLSEGVLAPAEGARDRVARISFTHHVLFDYAVARLILEEGRASDFAARLTSSDLRALLIAPGATMALQVLWQDDDAQRRMFWRKAFEIADSGGTGAFCRMLPARVAAALTKETGDFEPVLECLREPSCPDRAAAVFLVRHCTGALTAGIAPNSLLTSPLGAWPSIAHALVGASVADVGWMLKPLVAQWVEKPDLLTPGEAKDVNSAARLMLRHGSSVPYDSSMVIVGIQGVARTFGSAPGDSAAVLSRLLLRDHVTEHGHEELSWIAREMDHLLEQTPLSGELIRNTYRAGYCTPLPSPDEKTSLGNSRILSLTSNRRQDFEHAQWELFKQFPNFFAADPEGATEALIEIMDCYTGLYQKVDKEEQLVTFPFRDHTAAYLPDHSYAWLRRHNDHKAPPLRAFESGIASLIEAGRFDALERVLGTVIRKNRLASIWAALLRLGASKPEQFGIRLLPLVSAVPVLEGRDTRTPAGDLVKSLYPTLPPEDRAAVERAILGTHDHAQHVLLGCLEERSIVAPETRERRRELEAEGPLPANREPFEITTRWSGRDDDWWLRDEGVDLSAEPNAVLNEATRKVQQIKKRAKEAAQDSRHVIVEGWPDVQSLHDMVRSRQDTPEALLMSAWNAIAEAAEAAADRSDSLDDLAAFPGIKEMIVGALQPTLWPRPVADAEREAAFAEMPSWGSPAPRVEAAGALMLLARAQGAPDADLEELIQDLSRDPSPEVRHQILGHTNVLFEANQPLMWRLCAAGFAEEPNESVLSFFLSAVGRVMGPRPAWFADQLIALDLRRSSKLPEDRRDEFLAHVVNLLLHLWFVYDQQSAGDRVREWTADPVRHLKRIQDTLPALRGAIVRGDPENPDPLDDRVRTRAVEIFEYTVTKLTPVLAQAAERSQELSPDERGNAEAALRILDTAATEIYFGSGAHAGRNREDDETPVLGSADVRRRFLKEMGLTLAALAQVPYPSVTHHLLQTLQEFVPDDPPLIFRLVTDALASGGRSGGYQYESLGSELFVSIIRRYLADFRSLLASDDDLRHRLMGTLDIFVEAGWPQARRLVYDLPETLR